MPTPLIETGANSIVDRNPEIREKDVKSFFSPFEAAVKYSLISGFASI